MTCAGGLDQGRHVSRLSWSHAIGLPKYLYGQCFTKIPNNIISALLCSIAEHDWMSGLAQLCVWFGCVQHIRTQVGYTDQQSGPPSNFSLTAGKQQESRS